eukprot:gene20189-24165_t
MSAVITLNYSNRCELLLLLLVHGIVFSETHSVDVCWIWNDDRASLKMYIKTWHDYTYASSGSSSCDPMDPNCPMIIGDELGVNSSFYGGSMQGQAEPTTLPGIQCRGTCYTGTDYSWYFFDVKLGCNTETRIFYNGDPNKTCVLMSWLLDVNSESSQESAPATQLADLETAYSTLTALIFQTKSFPETGESMDRTIDPPINYTEWVCGFGFGITTLSVSTALAEHIPEPLLCRRP